MRQSYDITVKFLQKFSSIDIMNNSTLTIELHEKSMDGSRLWTGEKELITTI